MPKQRQEWLYTSVGMFIISALASLFFLIFKVSGEQYYKQKNTYDVTAYFNDIGGLRVHAPVTISGVRIGEVSKISLNPSNLNAEVELRLTRSENIPYDDVSARILTEGLLGASYISITPGFDNPQSKHSYLMAGDVIGKTQDAMILENLIGQLVFNAQK